MATDNSIQCAVHGDALATYVCEHLAANHNQRWYCDYPSAENRWPDAWCEQCDVEFRREGEWNERNEDKLRVKLICNHCYEDGIGSSVNSMDPVTFQAWTAETERCFGELCEKQGLLETDYSLSKHRRWDYDQETGLLVFSNDGIASIIAEIEMIGSVSTKTDTWLWSWANFHFLENIRSRITAVRDFGEKAGFPHLTVPKWPADEGLGWEASAIATHVLDAKGVYRVPTENGFLFMAITTVRYAT